MTRIYCKKGSKQVWKDIKVCRENCKRKCQNFKEKEEKLDTFEVIKSREMEPEERQMRMHRTRRVVREQNIYRWAGNLITELCELRLDAEQPRTKLPAAVAAA